MKKFIGRGKTLDDARRQAAIAGLSETKASGIAYTLDSVNGFFGGFVGADDVEVIIQAEVIGSKELCGDANEILAYQHNQKVVIVANGLDPSSGYKTFFEEKPITVFPPEFILYHVKPSEIVIPVYTPFQASISFNSEEPVKEVVVEDARGSHRIGVEPIAS